jgi:hypothetical protein
MSTLRETFLSELTDIYDAEKQLIKALPKMARAGRGSVDSNYHRANLFARGTPARDYSQSWPGPSLIIRSQAKNLKLERFRKGPRIKLPQTPRSKLLRFLWPSARSATVRCS